jgi:hypothetical protein
VNFYAGSLVLVKNKDSFTEDYCRLKDTRWIFPERERFPFLYSELNKLINISNSTSLKPYNFVTKWRGSRFFASSLDDFIEYTFKGYGNSSLGNNLQVGCLYSDWVTEKVEKLRTDSRGIVGFYARNDAWDVSIGHSETYLGSNRYRNPDESYAIALVESLLDLGFSVVRLGRSSTKLLSTTHNNYFDYAGDHTLWADKHDFLLWREVDFGIMTNGGACQPAFFFGKPFMIWDYCEHLEGILGTIPNYPKGHVILVPRINRDGINLSAQIHNKNFLERVCSALITKSSEISGCTQVSNILVCDQVY